MSFVFTLCLILHHHLESMCSNFLNELLAVFVVFLRWFLLLDEFKFESSFINKHPLGYLFRGDIEELVINGDLMEDAFFTRDCKLIHSLELIEHLVFLSIDDLDHLLDVQALYEVFGNNERSTNDNIIDVFLRQKHEESLLYGDDRQHATLVVPS